MIPSNFPTENKMNLIFAEEFVLQRKCAKLGCRNFKPNDVSCPQGIYLYFLV